MAESEDIFNPCGGKAFQIRTDLGDLDIAPVDFWRQAKKVGECWIWIGEKFDNGYGKLRRYSKLNPEKRIATAAHRYSYFLQYDYDPGELLGCHHCDNRSCIRPDHIFLGTDLANKHDIMRKRRLVCPDLGLSPDLRDAEALLSKSGRALRQSQVHPMAGIVIRGEGQYRVQIRRGRQSWCQTFRTLAEAQDWRDQMNDLLDGAAVAGA